VDRQSRFHGARWMGAGFAAPENRAVLLAFRRGSADGVRRV
jgi:hypothetical protein